MPAPMPSLLFLPKEFLVTDLSGLGEARVLMWVEAKKAASALAPSARLKPSIPEQETK